MSTPSLQLWNRLEPRPRTGVSLDRALRAEVRDALWMITRQWQLGELNAEDTGTAAFARLDMQTSRINRISKKGAAAATAFDETLPLECMIEREIVDPDLMLRMELGRQFLKILQYNLSAHSADVQGIEAVLRGSVSFTFSVPTAPPLNADYLSNPELWQATLAITDGRAIDGYKLLMHLKTTGNTVSNLPGLTLVSAPAALANAVGTDFIAWYNRVYSQPASPTDSYWLQSHLEYQVACSAPRTATDYTLLTAEEYYQGHLDWYSFDLRANSTGLSSLVAGPPQTSLIENKPFNVIPSKISFGGMPAPRWWEMEDRRIDFGGLQASTTDTARLLVADFGVLFSNDWSLLPYVVPTGSILNLRSVLVTDVFGQTTKVMAAGAVQQNVWNLYTLSTEGSPGTFDPRLFVPPSIDKMLESEPAERVNFMRDEMANMVWAVESIVPDGVDGGEPGVEAARRLTQYLESITPVASSSSSNDALIKYNIMSRVPENWIPFIPVRLDLQTAGLNSRAIQLQRAAMPRSVNNQLPTERVRPRTSLLRHGYNPNNNTWGVSYIHEEEVPRSGAILSRTWQRARMHNGAVALWLGRRKQNGRGEGSSGLRFDYVTPK